MPKRPATREQREEKRAREKAYIEVCGKPVTLEDEDIMKEFLENNENNNNEEVVQEL
uniref:Uncharacterized protein n=1 Tax=Meloidogyne javanica TaxID=6303 RepID=A0A915LZ04_MELJA